MSIEERVKRREDARAKKKQVRRRSRLKIKQSRSLKDRQAPEQPEVGEKTEKRILKKKRQGVVVSNKADKTITVLIESMKPHPTYKKILRRTRKLHAHDERNEAKEGDTVRVVECRPLSRTKNWRLDEIVKRAR